MFWHITCVALDVVELGEKPNSIMNVNRVAVLS
jgi:hypothetical protein